MVPNVANRICALPTYQGQVQTLVLDIEVTECMGYLERMQKIDLLRVSSRIIPFGYEVRFVLGTPLSFMIDVRCGAYRTSIASAQ